MWCWWGCPPPSPKDELWCIYSSQLAYPFFQALVFGSGKRTWLGQPKQSEPGRTHWGGISTDLFSSPGQPKYSEPVSGTTTASMVIVKQGTKGKRTVNTKATGHGPLEQTRPGLALPLNFSVLSTSGFLPLPLLLLFCFSQFTSSFLSIVTNKILSDIMPWLFCLPLYLQEPCS